MCVHAYMCTRYIKPGINWQLWTNSLIFMFISLTSFYFMVSFLSKFDLPLKINILYSIELTVAQFMNYLLPNSDLN